MSEKNTGQHGSDTSRSSSSEYTRPLSIRKPSVGPALERSKAHKPQLKFVNSTNPNQLRTQPFRKLVKQHAMLDAQKRRREAVQANIAKRRAQQALSEEASRIKREESGTPSHFASRYAYDDPKELAIGIQRFVGSSPVDPFRSLPQYSNSLVDASRLQQLTIAFFPSLKRSQQYVNTLTSSPIVFLADAHPGMILQDALDNAPRGSTLTIAAKTEIYTLLNRRLQSGNAALQLAPDVIAGVFNLILLENSYGQLDVVQAHLKGLRQMMHIIGGSRKAGFDPNLATIAVYQGLETGIYFEIPPEPVYLQLSSEVMATVAATSPTDLAWESPINGNAFSKTPLNEHSSPDTLWMLRAMRDLTVMFIEACFDNDTTLVNDFRAHRIYDDLLRMPSASVPGHPCSNDAAYECVRITSLIWCTAIVHNLPLSRAVHVAQQHAGSPDIVGELVRSLRRSGTSDCWGRGMIGAFMWVAKAGCAAFPNGSIPFKWLYLENARAAVHGLRHRLYLDILTGSETLLKVQEGLRRPPKRSVHELG